MKNRKSFVSQESKYENNEEGKMQIENDVIVYCAKDYSEKIYLNLLSRGCHVAFCDNAKVNQDG